VPHGVRSIESEPDDEQCYLVKLVLKTGPIGLVKTEMMLECAGSLEGRTQEEPEWTLMDP
jgi:hypothetical protein